MNWMRGIKNLIAFILFVHIDKKVKSRFKPKEENL